jgi:hypothetical protein
MTNALYISGLPRSGSTLLFNILKQNPALSKLEKGRQWGTDKSLPDLLLAHKPKIIVTYRPILEVEFPALYYRPLNDARCDWLMRPSGAIEMNNSVFKNMAIYKDWFHLITYEDICLNPKEAIAEVYDFLEIEPYEHDFENILQNDNFEDEEEFGIPTLHSIRPQISKSSTTPEDVLSEYVIQKYSNAMDFFTKGWIQFLS